MKILNIFQNKSMMNKKCFEIVISEKQQQQQKIRKKTVLIREFEIFLQFCIIRLKCTSQYGYLKI